MRRLEGKTALITGAAGGMGRETARRLAGEGALVAVTDLDHAAIAPLADEIGGEAFALDVGSPAAIRSVFRDFLRDGRQLDIVVNCAGIVDTTAIDTITPEAWDRVFDVNVRGTFLCCQVALEHMRDGGAIINIGSRAGLVGGTTSGASYASSKAAVICLTKSLAKFAAKRNIRANVINPGCINTGMLDNFAEETRRAMVTQSPLGRLGDPREIASVVAFLASDDSSFMTGAEVNVSGGSYM